MIQKVFSNRCLLVLVFLVFLCSPVQNALASDGERCLSLSAAERLIPTNRVKAVSSRTGSDPSPTTDINVSNLLGNESGVTIAVNPTNQENIVVVGHAPNFKTMNTFYSTDAGKTWTMVPLGIGVDEIEGYKRIDPAVHFDPSGNAYVAYGVVDYDHTALVVAKSSDGGMSYVKAAIIHTQPNISQCMPGSNKWLLTSGPDPLNPEQENLYVTWTHNEKKEDVIYRNIVVSTSTDGGATFSAPIMINDPPATRVHHQHAFASPAIGPNGELYVVWNTIDTGEIFLDISTDGGVTFGTDILITTATPLYGTSIPAQPDKGVFVGPVLDVDLSDGEFRGRLYLSYVNYSASGAPDTDIMVMASSDSGTTWTAPVRVNDDEGTNSQFLPWLDVDPETGVVSAVWYDARNDVNNQLVETFMAISDNGGASFGTNQLISDGKSNQSATNPDAAFHNFQKYIGVASSGCQAFVVWADNSANAADLDFYTQAVQLNGLDTPLCNMEPECKLLVPEIAECNAEIPMSAEGCTDPENDVLAFLWSGPFTGSPVEGVTPSVQFPGPTGVKEVTLVVSDGLAESQCMAEVTVQDTLPPVITAPAEKTAECTAPEGTPYLPGEALASDQCDTELIITHDGPALFPLGPTTVTWTATDDDKNTATATQKITIADTTPPALTLPANATGECTAPDGTPIELGNAEATDQCHATVEITNKALESYPLGTTEVEWTAKDGSDNKTTGLQLVTVTDSTAPTLTIPDDIPKECTSPDGTPVELGIATALDQCDAEVIPTHNGLPLYPVGPTEVTWRAVDDSGNETTQIQNIIISDGTAPTFTPPTDVTKECSDPGGTPVDLGSYDVSDGCDNDVTVQNDAGETFPVGTTVVNWTATDDGGNATTATQNVIISDNTPPVVSIALSPVQVNGEDDCLFEVQISALDGCDTAPNVEASLTLQGCGQKIPVVNGQTFRFEKDDDECGVEKDGDVMELTGSEVTGFIQATDAAGNGAEATTLFTGCPWDD